MSRCEHDDSTEKLRGWYNLSEVLIGDVTYLVGAYGHWSGDDNNSQKIELSKACLDCQHEMPLKEKKCTKCGLANFKKTGLSDDQKKALAAQLKENQARANAMRKKEKAEAARIANAAWYQLSKTGACDYLQKKNITAPANVRYGLADKITIETIGDNGRPSFVLLDAGINDLVYPMMDVDDRIVGLQILRGSGYGDKRQKDNWPYNVGVQGSFFKIGAPSNIVLVVEGFATGMTLNLATGLQVLVAFNAGNLMPVAIAFHSKFKKCKLLICADDDYLVNCRAQVELEGKKTRCNHPSLAGVEQCPKCSANLFSINRLGEKEPYGRVGEKRASAAALAVGGAWLKPIFEADREGKKLTDFNDLANFPNCSNSTVMVQIQDKIKSLGWVSQAPARASNGGGDSNSPPIKSTLKSLLDVSEAVERYSLIYGAGGTMYDHQESSLIPKSDVLDICVDHAWREWKLHPERSVVRLSEVGFDPTEKDAQIYCNLWGGWPTVPKQGQCGSLLSLLEHLCSGEEKGNNAVYQWVLKWLAFPIQNQGAKMRTALIFHGPQGAGKNLFFEAYSNIFGKYGRIIGQAEIDDKFNDWASGKLFMIADEVVARQELFHIKNKIKALITGETIRINPKNVAAHDERNHVNLVFLSNEKQPLVLEQDDRRFAVIWTPQKLGEGYYSDVATEINNGGIAALHQYLLDLPLGDFSEHSKPPLTQSKTDLININLESGDRFMEEWLAGEIDVPVCPVISEDLYYCYKKWCERNGVSRPRELNQIVGNIVKIAGWSRARPRIFSDYHFTKNTDKQRSVIIPPPHLHSEKQKKGADLTETQWLTTCCLDFSTALRGENA